MRPGLDLNSKDLEKVSQSKSSANSYRQEALMRYREKKKKRNFMNRVKYESRQEAASRMKRHKGQFVSSKANIDAEGNPSNENNAEEETIQTNPMFCQNCMISKDETPTMRRGPNGPGSLCNPCGLKWAHTGIAQIPPEVYPSSVDEDLQDNRIDQIDDNDIRVPDLSWDGLIMESAETGQAGKES